MVDQEILTQLVSHMRNAAKESDIADKQALWRRIVGVVGYACGMHAGAHMIVEKITGTKLGYTEKDATAYAAFLAGLSLADEDPATAMAILRDMNALSEDVGVDSISILIGKAAAVLAKEWSNE